MFELHSTYLRRIDVALGAAKGVAAVHDLLGGGGYSHNDIKSANFLCHELEQNGDEGYRQIEVKIADVEFASAEKNQTMWETEEVDMTPNWAAPELYGSAPQPMNQNSDIFSLGMVLFEIVSRRVPFEEFRDSECRKKYKAGERPSLPLIFSAPRPIRASGALGQGPQQPQYDSFAVALRRQQDHTTAVEKGHGASTEILDPVVDRISRSSVNSIDATSDHSMVEVAKEHLKRLNDAQAGENIARLLAYESIIALMSQCWSQDPSSRPSASEVVQRLEEVRSIYVVATNVTSDIWRNSIDNAWAARKEASMGAPSEAPYFMSAERPTDQARHARTSSHSSTGQSSLLTTTKEPAGRGEIALAHTTSWSQSSSSVSSSGKEGDIA